MRKTKGKNSKLLPNSLRIISSCIKTVSTNATTAVRSAGASVAASISASDDRKEQVLWAGFDKLELSPTASRCVLLLGYVKGFQVFDVEDASGLSELVSRRDGPVSFLQMLPAPTTSNSAEKYKSSHPLLAVVGGDEEERFIASQNPSQGFVRYGSVEPSLGNTFDPPSAVRFYSMKSNEYVKVIDFKSPVLMVRCSRRVVAIGLTEQIYCFDTITLEKKFVVITYPVPSVGEQGGFGINTGCGPMAVGSRWLAYPPNRPFLFNMGRVSPKSLASSVSPSTSPGSGSLMARYALESSKHLAAGILTLGDMGIRKLSQYYPEMLPDGSSSPGWKTGKLAVSESENAGWIAVKDLACSEVISQFRAHTSPISALCFDPSGTLLVTASVCGNNINIFRIMPSHACGGSGSNDWSTSYAHLYKLHRGLTTAVIQDICFSHYSQWIAVVTSRGTCHVFILSPYGGDCGLQALEPCGQGTSLFLAVNQPWWFTSTFTTNEQKSIPPPPCTLSVVTRVKCSDTGLLNSVSNAAASVAGKLWVPSGAVAAIFHNSNSRGSLDVNSNVKPLEHILVYTPSGFVVQHEIKFSMGIERSASRKDSLSPPEVNPPNEEPRLKVEPIQWWDVCRRLDNLEREERISGSIYDGQSDAEIDDDSRIFLPENASIGDEKLVKCDPVKSTEKSHWYLSNAEVQIHSGRLPVWQKSKMHFHLMQPPRVECHVGGEFEIERASSLEVEIRHKDLLPVFDHLPSTRYGWIDRSIPADESRPNTPGNSQAKNNEASIICHSKPPSFSSTESSEGGSSRRIENLLDLDHTNIDNLKASPMDPRSRSIMPFTSAHTRSAGVVVDKNSTTGSCSIDNEIPPFDVDNSDSAAHLHNMPSGVEDTVNFEQFFKEGYCHKPELDNHHKPTEGVTNEVDADGNTHDENSDEEGWTGGMFDFSE